MNTTYLGTDTRGRPIYVDLDLSGLTVDEARAYSNGMALQHAVMTCVQVGHYSALCAKSNTARIKRALDSLGYTCTASESSNPEMDQIECVKRSSEQKPVGAVE